MHSAAFRQRQQIVSILSAIPLFGAGMKRQLFITLSMFTCLLSFGGCRGESPDRPLTGAIVVRNSTELTAYFEIDGDQRTEVSRFDEAAFTNISAGVHIISAELTNNIDITYPDGTTTYEKYQMSRMVEIGNGEKQVIEFREDDIPRGRQKTIDLPAGL